MDYVNDDLYRAADDDPLFFIRWPPSMNQLAVTKRDLLTRLKPTPLPKPADPPAEPPPATPPPSQPPTIDDETEEFGVAWAALRVRQDHSTASKQIGLLRMNQVVRIARAGRVQNGENTWGRLTHVDGSKFGDIGWVALEGLIKKV